MVLLADEVNPSTYVGFAVRRSTRACGRNGGPVPQQLCKSDSGSLCPDVEDRVRWGEL